MQLHKTKGIVLKGVKYGETSLVVTIYTELFGIQSELADLKARHAELEPLFRIKREFVQRQAAKKITPQEAAAFDGDALFAQLQQLQEDRTLGQVGDDDPDLAGTCALQFDVQIGRPLALKLRRRRTECRLVWRMQKKCAAVSILHCRTKSYPGDEPLISVRPQYLDWVPPRYSEGYLFHLTNSLNAGAPVPWPSARS